RRRDRPPLGPRRPLRRGSRRHRSSPWGLRAPLPAGRRSAPAADRRPAPGQERAGGDRGGTTRPGRPGDRSMSFLPGVHETLGHVSTESRSVLYTGIVLYSTDDPEADAVLVSDRKSTRLNSSHVSTSYAVFCL